MNSKRREHIHTHIFTRQNTLNLYIYCTFQKAKLALCNKSITVHGGMEKATFTEQPLCHTPSCHFTVFIAVQMHSVYLPTLQPNLGKMREIKSGLEKSLHFPPLNCHCWPVIYEMKRNKCNAPRAEQKATRHDRNCSTQVGVPGLNEKSFAETFTEMDQSFLQKRVLGSKDRIGEKGKAHFKY